MKSGSWQWKHSLASLLIQEGSLLVKRRPFILLGRTGDFSIFSWTLWQLTFFLLQKSVGLWRGFGVVDGCVVLPSFPQLVAVRLVLVHKHIHGNLHHVLTAWTLRGNHNYWLHPHHCGTFGRLQKDVWAYQCGLFAVIDPPLSGKVSWLGTVEAMVEPSVIAEWECDNELACLLSHLQGKNKLKTWQPFIFLVSGVNL